MLCCLSAWLWQTSDLAGIVLTLVVWGLFIIEHSLGMPVLGPFRPALLFVASPTLQGSLVLFADCVLTIRSALMLFFTVVMVSAILIFTLYAGRLDSLEGDTTNSFFDCFIISYVFLESADNWERNLFSALSTHCDCF